MADLSRWGDKSATGAGCPESTIDTEEGGAWIASSVRRIRGNFNTKISGRHRESYAMGHMFTCSCSWTIITQEGEDDLKMHIKIHLADAHPGTTMSDEDIRRAIKTV